jgi:soluble lytic murein transglycosylase-like protein
VDRFDEIYRKHAAEFGVDWRLLKAIAQVESSENPLAVNAADRESLGLMQILCQPDGQGGCRNRLNVTGWRHTTRERLLDADWNVYIGAQVLAWNIEKYGLPRGIAVYNAWDQRSAPIDGPFRNQGYVDRVIAKARALGMAL